MTDDIVTRLRGESLVQTKPCIRGGCCEICESILNSAKEAADEIERLRAANAHQAKLIRYFLDNAVPYIKHHPHCFAWWEHQSNEDCKCGAGEVILAYTQGASYGDR